MKIPIRSSLLKFSGKILLCLVIGGFWYHPIVPFLFYITFADTEMKEQMVGDLWELHGYVPYSNDSANSVKSLTVTSG